MALVRGGREKEPRAVQVDTAPERPGAQAPGVLVLRLRVAAQPVCVAKSKVSVFGDFEGLYLGTILLKLAETFTDPYSARDLEIVRVSDPETVV